MSALNTTISALLVAVSQTAMSSEPGSHLDGSLQSRDAALATIARIPPATFATREGVPETRMQVRTELLQWCATHKNVVGEFNDASTEAVAKVPASKDLAETRADVRSELAAWQATHRHFVGEFNGEPDASVVNPRTQAPEETRGEVKAETKLWFSTHKLVAGDRG